MSNCRLQGENDYLVGKYSETSEQLQDEIINLPGTVEELHELVLRKHEELITAKIAKEAAEENTNTLKSDITLLSDKIQDEQLARESLQEQYNNDNDLLR